MAKNGRFTAKIRRTVCASHRVLESMIVMPGPISSVGCGNGATKARRKTTTMPTINSRFGIENCTNHQSR